jgi:flagellar basal-body rod protein FlgB
VLQNGSVGDLFSTVGNLHHALDYHLERQNVLASNIAHVDTPGYVPHDLARKTEFAGHLDAAMARTQAGHLAGGDGPNGFEVFADPGAGQTGKDENQVSLDREAAKVAANQIRYDVVTALASADLAALAYAATDGRG